MQEDITSMTEAHGANGVPSLDEIRQVLQKAEKGDKKALPALRTLLDKCPWLSRFYGSLAQTAREALVKRIGGDKNLAAQECYTRMRNRGFVCERGGRFSIHRRRKLSTLVPNEIILHALREFFETRFGSRRTGHLLDLGAGLKPYAVLYESYFAECVSVDHPHSQHDVDVDILASAESLPIAAESFDCILCTEVLEHCGDPDAALAEMRRVLKPGGLVFLTTPFLVSLHEMPYDFYRYTPSAIELMGRRVGLDIESIVTKGDFVAVLMSFSQFPVTKAWQALSAASRSANPFLWLTVVLPQLAYLAYWRHCRRSPRTVVGRVYRRLEYVTLGYVTVLRRP